MAASLEQLVDIADRTKQKLLTLPTGKAQGLLVMQYYHGFRKARFSDDFLHEVTKGHDLAPEDIQLEVVSVEQDLTDEIHRHHFSIARIICLGAEEGFSDARLAEGCLDLQWFPVKSGEALTIPAGAWHGFTVKDGGELWFLSVQSPPIVSADGKDDYEKYDPNRHYEA